MADREKSDPTGAGEGRVSRRGFMKTVAAAGAGAGAATAATHVAFVGEARAAPDDINIAMIGTGSQGLILMKSCVKIPGVRFKAICDIWNYSRRYGKGTTRAYKQDVNVYIDYREMLAKETDLDAVIIATPDWVHADQTVACLEAGVHVYCEKEMSNSLDECRRMVRAARKTGKLLQIGHQRRSNPRYLHAEKFVHKDKVLGRITHCYGQWNRSQRLYRPIPKHEKWIIDEASLKKYGYDTMERFRNWRWYRKYSGGAIADLGSHQVDIFNWFLQATPKSVVASGGVDYYKRNEWYDNVMAIYEYETAQGTARAFYQVLNTTSFGGFYETFMGDKGSLQISEDIRIGFFVPEPNKPTAEWVDKTEGIEGKDQKTLEIELGASRNPDGTQTKESVKAEEDAKKPAHQPHVENFFAAIRGKAKLTCPAEEALMTAVPILKTNDAVGAGKRMDLTPADYEV